MAYEVTAAADAPSERLVVAVGGVTLVYGEPLDQDRDAEGVVIVAEADEATYVTDNQDIAADLVALSERVPEVAAAVQVEHVVEVDEQPEVSVEQVHVIPVDPPDTVVAAGETSPKLERETVEVDPEEAGAVDRFVNEGGPADVEPSDPGAAGESADEKDVK